MRAAVDLLDAYADAAPADAARACEGLDAATAADVFDMMGAAAAARVLQAMAPSAATRCLCALSDLAASRIGDALPVETLTGLLRRVEAGDRSRLVAALRPDTADAARRLLSSPEGTAGAVMDPFVPVVQADATAGDARAFLRREFSRLHDYLYAVDTGHILVGVVDVAALMAADAAAPVRAVTRAGVMWLQTDMPLGAVVAHPGWVSFDALPVVDRTRRLAGVVRHRRLRQLAAASGVGGAPDPTMRTLVSLGEVYWLGLCGLMQGLATTAAARTDAGAPGGAR